MVRAQTLAATALTATALAAARPATLAATLPAGSIATQFLSSKSAANQAVALKKKNSLLVVAKEAKK